MVLPCLALPCLAMPCLALPCHAMLCNAVPCHAFSCHALPCFSLSSFPSKLCPTRHCCSYMTPMQASNSVTPSKGLNHEFSLLECQQNTRKPSAVSWVTPGSRGSATSHCCRTVLLLGVKLSPGQGDAVRQGVVFTSGVEISGDAVPTG